MSARYAETKVSLIKNNAAVKRHDAFSNNHRGSKRI